MECLARGRTVTEPRNPASRSVGWHVAPVCEAFVALGGEGSGPAISLSKDIELTMANRFKHGDQRGLLRHAAAPPALQGKKSSTARCGT